MRRALVVTVLWMACTPAEPPATPPPPERTTSRPSSPAAARPAPPSSPPSSARPAPVPERNIYVDSVEMANPIVVVGRARTFENNVALRARDERGALLTETFTTSTGEMGHHNAFRAVLWVTRDPGASITVEALEYSARDGAEQSLVSVVRPFDVEIVEARLSLPNRDCTGVVAHTRRLPKSISMARLLVEALIAEPAPFPKGSRVESINLRGGTITVNFNDRLQNVGGACAAQMIRESVTRTLLELPSVKKVVITAGGSEALALQP